MIETGWRILYTYQPETTDPPQPEIYGWFATREEAEKVEQFSYALTWEIVPCKRLIREGKPTLYDPDYPYRG